MRSCMPATPKVCRAGFGFAGIPTPSSSMSQANPIAFAGHFDVSTLVALACLATLCSASCTTR